MIFVDYSLLEWLEKYPNLEILKLNCDSCGKELISDKPFVEKGYVGLISNKCICGKNKHICISKITNSKDTYDYWSKKLNEWT
jgi:transcription elongation factor Elf1